MKKQVVLAAALTAFLFQSAVFAAERFINDYLSSPYGEVYKNSYGECWRSRFDEATHGLGECGYEKPKVPIVEKELVITPTAATLTTSVVEKINIRAALLFDFDSAVLSEDAKAVLEERIAKYKGRGELTSNVSVIGHTDSYGSEVYNQKLSERRARTVAEFLEQYTNIVDEKIKIIGKGESEPEVSNDTSAGRELNRRVIIILNGIVNQ